MIHAHCHEMRVDHEVMTVLMGEVVVVPSVWNVRVSERLWPEAVWLHVPGQIHQAYLTNVFRIHYVPSRVRPHDIM